MKKVLGIFAAFSLLIVPIIIRAQSVNAAVDTCTWDGSTDGLWSDGSNWSGCDNGGVPQAGDTLFFPLGASNLSMNNNLGALIFDSVYALGDGYTFGGNDINVQYIFSFSGIGNTVDADINYINAGSSTMNISSGATGNVINGDIDLALTAGGDMNLNVLQDITHNGLISGSTDLLFQGVSTNSWKTSTTDLSTFTATAANINSGNFECNNINCLGAAANPVLLTGTGGAIFLATPSLIVPNTLGISAHNPNGNLRATNTSGASPRWGGAITLSSDATFSANDTLAILGFTNIGLGANTLNFIGIGGIFSNGVISGTGGLDLAMTNQRVSLGGTNTYSGSTLVQAGSIINVGSNDALGTTAGATVVESGATIAATSAVANLTIPENITISGTGEGGAFSNGAITHEGNPSIDFDHTYSGTITLAGDTLVTHVGATSTNITINDLAGTGDLTFEPSAFGDSLNLAGSSPNTYTGTLNVHGSFLNLQKNGAATGDINITDTVMNAFLAMSAGLTDAIADTAVVTVGPEASSANFSVANGESETIGALAGTDGNVFVGAGATLTLAGSGTETFTGSFAGGGTIVKTGTGTQILTGSCAVADNFNVLGGNLVFSSPFSTSDCDVAINGGTLKGDGQLNNVVGNSGNFNAGNSPGCMTITGVLTLNGPTVFDAELAGTTACTQYDRTNVDGNVVLNNPTLNVIPSFTPTPGTVFTIIEAGNVLGNITGTFDGLPDGATFTANGIQFRINYTDTQVNLTVIGGTLADTGHSATKINILAAILILGSATGLLIIKKRGQLGRTSNNNDAEG